LGTRLRGTERIELDVKGPSREVAKALGDIKGVIVVEREPSPEGGGYSTFYIQASHGVDLRPRLAAAVVGNGWDLRRLESIGMSLEEIFLHLTTMDEGIAVEEQEVAV
ncbi:MAG: hypothetical protein L0177_14610, partial [Chloroflexi bacterium]|nr:hypothetical protein [Chloroflexota bacterium]